MQNNNDVQHNCHIVYVFNSLNELMCRLSFKLGHMICSICSCRLFEVTCIEGLKIPTGSCIDPYDNEF